VVKSSPEKNASQMKNKNQSTILIKQDAPPGTPPLENVNEQKKGWQNMLGGKTRNSVDRSKISEKSTSNI
jgi:hypothetical protein